MISPQVNANIWASCFSLTLQNLEQIVAEIYIKIELTSGTRRECPIQIRDSTGRILI